MAKLILLRHIKSQWNKENRFTGWTDIPLDKEKTFKAKELSEKVFQFAIDKIYCSPLFRNQDTVSRILEQTDRYPIFIHLDGGRKQKWGNHKDTSQNDFPVFVSEALNERYYGELQGENKETAKEKYGEEKVHLWRRGYEAKPPGGESLKDVIKRTVPFYRKYIEKDLKQGKNVLIVASHNSLRSIVKYIEGISDKKIINLEIPYAGLIEYTFNELLKLENKTIL